MSFDLDLPFKTIGKTVSIPFDQGNVFRLVSKKKVDRIVNMSQSLSNRAMSFDMICGYVSEDWHQSQSLSNRAMSFDWSCADYFEMALLSQSLSNRAMSFDAFLLVKPSQLVHRLNPFRTGRCLSTRKGASRNSLALLVSIPFEQGDVFRLNIMATNEHATMSQSLSNRAMSFDCLHA